jgi:hypothetical protein
LGSSLKRAEAGRNAGCAVKAAALEARARQVAMVNFIFGIDCEE